ncbi:shikimate dehydrogenase [Heliobacterium gestii]|uniref:Shikimate dehydrogenase n=1 Tax=Heliomicrobium gestii TaxID=2699 RepID=A0A845LBP5_HELGE|nr:shikimate dehydrogenase [Heliomicrobium gestii]MBM7866483.1 putative amino acid dehydrogenase [Heliomicrobium gestii]MZP42734.1 shikimate dehydrogenase [Heliomicrobium gestii]
MKRFAFIIHPLTVADIARKFPWIRWLPEGLVEGVFRWAPPVRTARFAGIRSDYGQVEGLFVACPLTTRQMLSLPEEIVLPKVEAACRKAIAQGAQLIGLGAYTSIVGDAGLTLARRLPVPVTTGNSYTVATALEATRIAAAQLGHSLNRAAIAVVGATGSIGAVCSRLLAREAGDLTLVARQSDRLDRLAYRILHETGLSVRVMTDVAAALRRADIVVAVSSAAGAIIEPEYLKAGSLVCDVARPRDVSRRVSKERPDVLLIEGGVVKVPGDVDFGFNFGFPPGLAYACMAETMILALEGRRECFSLGRELFIDKVEEITRLARKHGFALAGLRSFDRPLRELDVERVRKSLFCPPRTALGSQELNVDNILQPGYNTKLKMVE